MRSAFWSISFISASSSPSSEAMTTDTPVVPEIASVSPMLAAPRAEAQTRPTVEPAGRAAISWTRSM